MKRTMKTTMKTIMMMAILAGGLVGCDDSGGGPGPDMAMSLIPAAPTLGAAIDRMGRPAINTALNNTFNPDDVTKGAAKDAYNSEGNQANWASLMVNGTLITKEFAGNLAILDALDGVCGNQLLAKGDSTGDAGATEYASLPGVLVDDELYVDTSIADCGTKMQGGITIPNYLAVEARFLGQQIFTSCGGRTPLDDVIDVSYTVLAAGLSAQVSDGVDKDADGTASLSAFPFLTAPN